MNLTQIITKYPDHEACIEHLEWVRWYDKPECPHCGSYHVARRADGERVGRWNCHDCKSSFNVLSGTIFEKTRVPLQKWFLAIALMVNAKKDLSSCQMASDIGTTQPTAWRIMQCIRVQIMSNQQNIRLQDIVADESYVGGRGRHRGQSKRGCITNKVLMIKFVERGLNGTLLMTDEFSGYRCVDALVPRAVIEHNQRWTDGVIHTNTIESFWALVKRAWMGQQHCKKEWMPLCVAERCWMYNKRTSGERFKTFVWGLFS